MNKLTFCPLINNECRPDCIFFFFFNIALNNGNTAQCELAAFVCCADETAIQAVSEAIKNLRS